MASKYALMRAAQAWCKSTTRDKVMDTELAEAFADIIDEEYEIIELIEDRIAEHKAKRDEYERS